MICAPGEDVAADQLADDADVSTSLVGAGREGQRIDEGAPSDTVKAKMVAAMMPGSATGMKIFNSDLQLAGAVDQRRLVQFLRDRARSSRS